VEYTAFFNGTSSASPFVAASCAILQQTANDVFGQPVAPVLLRQHLIDTGVPQGLGGNIGPFPDLKLAVDGVGTLLSTVWTDLGNGLASPLGTPVLKGTGSLAPGQSWEITLANGTPNALAAMIIGANQVNLSFFGGILVPSPDTLFLTQIFGDGSWKMWGYVPDTFPPGIVVYFQVWIRHALGPHGISASNGLRGAAP
jgi:hypothetical protein